MKYTPVPKVEIARAIAIETGLLKAGEDGSFDSGEFDRFWAEAERVILPDCDLTAKGRAFLIAIDTGLVVPVEGEYRAARFDAFWRRLEAEVLPGPVAGIGWGRRDAAWRSSGSSPVKTARM